MALGGVGALDRHQLADHRHDGVHGLGDAGLEGGSQRAQGRCVGVVGGEVAARDYVDRHALGRSLGVDLVIHVGDVGRIEDRLFAEDVAQHPEQQVEHDHGPEIADVGEIVDRGAAHIHRHPARIGGDEPALFAAHGVVEKKFAHGARVALRVRRPI